MLCWNSKISIIKHKSEFTLIIYANYLKYFSKQIFVILGQEILSYQKKYSNIFYNKMKSIIINDKR